MSNLVLAILLLTFGIAIAMLELFIPSAGLLGLIAFGSVIAALVMAFLDGRLTFIVFGGITLIVLPLGLALAMKYWPRTPIGRRLMLRAPKRDDVLPSSRRRDELHDLVGKLVEAKCDMLPGGAVAFNGRSIDAMSEGIAIEAGQMVRVVRVDGNRLVVRPVDNDEPRETGDDLSKPIDSLGIDPEANPFA